MADSSDSESTRDRLLAAATAAIRLAVRAGSGALRLATQALAGIWAATRPVLRTVVQTIFALLILLEEWGWRPLAELLGLLVRWRPWARLEAGIAALPPYGALVVFALPTLLLLPLKFLALFLIAKGQLVLAGLLFAAAKVGATALVARLFLLTRPALMQIAWFAWAYERFIPWKERLEAYVRASYVWRVGRIWKERVRRAAAAQWRTLRPAALRLREAARVAAARLAVQARRLLRQAKARWAVLRR